MIAMPWGEFRRLNTDEVDKILPITITVNGEAKWVLGKQETTIDSSDMHIRVQHQLKGAELRARAGMPKPPVSGTMDAIQVREMLGTAKA